MTSARPSGDGEAGTAALTVVIPLYDGARFIGETLDSLARQTRPLADVIVVDDGSSDDGPEIVARHPLGPRLVRQSSSGAAVARNRGALLAQTSHVAFLDQDDLWMPARHARLARYLDHNPNCQALVTSAASFYLEADGAALAAADEGLHRQADHPAVTSISELLVTRDDGSVPARTRVLDTRSLLTGPPSVTASYVVGRETFMAAGGCATFARSFDDYWALLNLSRMTEVAHVDEPSLLYRIHPTSTTMTTSWPLPLLTSLAAARYGGNLVPVDRARDPGLVVPLEDERLFWRHQLLELSREGRFGPWLDGLALTRLLGCGLLEQLRVAATVTRSAVAAAGRRRRG